MIMENLQGLVENIKNTPFYKQEMERKIAANPKKNCNSFYFEIFHRKILPEDLYGNFDPSSCLLMKSNHRFRRKPQLFCGKCC